MCCVIHRRDEAEGIEVKKNPILSINGLTLDKSVAFCIELKIML